ncbi:LAMI_0F00870g1_1 [Lachancea mirantina]|uniref:LAMI_0F00870g1_1 n=1 Tax=Lachancea mirantina TaxID=1230905 RepID=A0A1G4JVK3_9SACH|nr:LAMI_0F00870g1_1 [Lachancea mirantina]
MTTASKSSVRVLQQFQASGKDFSIFFGRRTFDRDAKLLVLDSSFNPPHWAHYNLVQSAFEHYKAQNLHVLLLLSVNNADKKPQPASFDERMDMMMLMAQLLTRNFIPTSAALTVFGKFAQKSAAIHQELGATLPLVYLVGFDTLIRIFDAKYYIPHAPAEALKDFMTTTQFYCLTRGASGLSESDQATFVDDIKQGRYEPNIPSSWHSKLVIENSKDEYSDISSSSIRQKIAHADDTVRSLLPGPIFDYIKQHSQKTSIFGPNPSN